MPKNSTGSPSQSEFCGYLEYSRKRFRLIPRGKTWINSRTPVGEDAEYFERKAHNGKREFFPLLEIVNGEVAKCFLRSYNQENQRWEYLMTKALEQFIILAGINIPAQCGVSKTCILKTTV